MLPFYTLFSTPVKAFEQKFTEWKRVNANRPPPSVALQGGKGGRAPNNASQSFAAPRRNKMKS